MASNSFIRMLKRGWRVIAVFGALGLILGSMSASISPQADDAEQSGVFAASAVLGAGGGLSVPVNAATAYLADPVIGEQVAAELGGEPAQLRGHVVATSNQQLGTIAITAVAPDADRAEQIADAFALAFATRVGELEQQKTQSAETTAFERASELLTKLGQQQELIDNADPSSLEILKAQYDSLLEQYRSAESDRLAAQSRAAGVVLTPQRDAVAEPINRDNFDAYIQRITGSSSKKGKDAAPPAPGALALAGALEPVTPPPPPNPVTRGVMGMGAGMVLGVIALLATDRLDPRLRTKEQVEEICGYPVVAEIPPLTRRQRLGTDVLSVDEPLSRAAEAYRVLRSAVLFASSADDPAADHPTPPQVLLVTSPGPSEGKTTTTANLAAVLGEAGYSVLVVNCDFRRPRVKAYLGGPDDDRRVSETRIPRVHLVDHVVDDENELNPAEMAAAQRRVVRTAREMFDVVILDTAPLLTTNDATELLSLADMVVLVVQAGRTNAVAAERAAELLERRQAKVLGITLVGATDVPTARYYYYDSGVRPEPTAAESDSTSDGDVVLDAQSASQTLGDELSDELRQLSVPERRTPKV